MATIEQRDIVDNIIANDGWYVDDDGEKDFMRVVKIVEYRNSFNGGVCYGLIFERESLDRYRASEFIRNPVTLWEADN